jgi:hypothetical protein
MFMYGGENWALNRNEKKKTATAEMHFLRRVSGYTRTFAGHVVSTAIRSALQILALD